ncbi:Primase C terminal 2 (PriCT-2) [Fulvimarina manganoxydans]|uniref:Primase C terminal 2 (PriCT-2) n=1 Tax=Fulvimarina manganoxydans TaxID=937218 RepID=A0A1W2ER35_9HYPH|nr:DUF3987 domain-containing protein [Fulvimarina manganoxydans]SMD12115.1 Primase C terminal 2 (PriCT-2) [Fulvimarina manganoxydans]
MIPLAHNEKRPVWKDWAQVPTQKYSELSKNWNRWFNIGVRTGKWSKTPTGYLMVLDVDIRTEKWKKEAIERLKAMFGDKIMDFPRQVSGSNGLSFHIFFACNEPFPGKTLYRSDEKVRVDGKERPYLEISLMGTGRQVVLAPSVHPDSGQRYRWENPIDELDGLPKMPAERLVDLVFAPEDDADDQEAVGLTYEQAESYIEALPDAYADDRDLWIGVAMALEHEFGRGDDEALAIFDRFSKRCPDKYDKRVVRKQFKTLRGRGRPRTMRSVIEASNEAEREMIWEELPDEFEDIPENLGEPPRPMSREAVLALFDEIDADDKVVEVKSRVQRSSDPDMAILDQAYAVAPPAPLDILPKLFANECREVAKATGSPVDFPMMSLLVTAASLMSGSVEFSPHSAWKEPSILWCQCIGDPGTAKSHGMIPFVKAGRKLIKQFRGPFMERRKQWEFETEKADKAYKVWKHRIAEGAEDVEQARPNHTIAPPKPYPRQFTVEDTTWEGLTQLMGRNGGHGVLKYDDQQTDFLNNMSRYSGGNDRPRYLKTYGAMEQQTARKSDEDEQHSVRMHLNILGAIQPEPLKEFSETVRDGFQTRFMPSWPEFKNGEIPIDREEIIPKVSDRVMQALEKLAVMHPDKGDQSEPEPFQKLFSEEAWRYFHSWRSEHRFKEQFEQTGLKLVYDKADGHVVRVAGVLAYLDFAADPMEIDPPETISLDAVKRAIRFREDYLKPMQIRVYLHCTKLPETGMAKSIAQWIVSKGIKEFTVREVSRAGGLEGISHRIEPDDIKAALQYLQSRRWGVYEDHVKTKGRPTTRFTVNEALWRLLDEIGYH